jgi:hypothetical protein
MAPSDRNWERGCENTARCFIFLRAHIYLFSKAGAAKNEVDAAALYTAATSCIFMKNASWRVLKSSTPLPSDKKDFLSQIRGKLIIAFVVLFLEWSIASA